MTAIGILSPGHPREPGGVTDMTSRLVRHWSGSGTIVSVAADLAARPESVVGKWAALGVEGVLLHYVPFLYGRRGISAYPERVAVAARARGMRVVLFIHEPWVPLTRPQWLILGPIQRIQLRRLVRRVSAAVTPVPAWRALVSPTPGLQYVGSTLGDPPPDPGGPPLDAPVVFSPFGSGLDWPSIAAAVDAIGASLIVLGATEEEGRHHPHVRRWIRPNWDWRGRLPASETLALLMQAPLVLAPFVDGITGRRTSAAAALSAGARLVTSTGPLFDPFFRDAPVDLAGSSAEFADLAARRWATPDSPADRARRLEWYQRSFDPRALDARLLQVVLGHAA